MLGNLAMGRFHSKHIALREYYQLPQNESKLKLSTIYAEIKAMEEGVFGRRYTNPNE